MVNIISDYIPPFSPLPNIAPFTYKDGETYLTTLDNLRVYVNTSLVDFINTNFTELSDSFSTEVNTLIASVNSQLALQDTSITDQVNAFIATVNAMFVTQAAAAAAATTTQVTAELATFVAGEDAAVAAFVDNTGSATRAALDSHYGAPTGTDADVAGYVNNGGSATTAALGAQYRTLETNANATYITDGSGAQGYVQYGYAATPSTIVYRDSNGRFSAADPSVSSEVANKGYVDSAVSGGGTGKVPSVVTNSIVYANDAGGTIAPIVWDTGVLANTIARRDSGGRMQANTPISSNDVVNKSYSDAKLSILHISSITNDYSLPSTTDAIVTVSNLPGMFLYCIGGSNYRAVGNTAFSGAAAITSAIPTGYESRFPDATVTRIDNGVTYKWNSTVSKWIPFSSLWLIGGIIPGNSGIALGSGGTGGGISAYYKYENGSIVYRGIINFNSGVSLTATAGYYLNISLPTGIGILYNTLPNIGSLVRGMGKCVLSVGASSLPTNLGTLDYDYAAKTIIPRIKLSGSSYDGLNSVTGPASFVSSDYLSWEFSAQLDPATTTNLI